MKISVLFTRIKHNNVKSVEITSVCNSFFRHLFKSLQSTSKKTNKKPKFFSILFKTFFKGKKPKFFSILLKTFFKGKLNSNCWVQL